MYRDLNQEPELRIHAYLAAVMCPDESVVNNIRQTLAVETSNQVQNIMQVLFSHNKITCLQLI